MWRQMIRRSAKFIPPSELAPDPCTDHHLGRSCPSDSRVRHALPRTARVSRARLALPLYPLPQAYRIPLECVAVSSNSSSGRYRSESSHVIPRDKSRRKWPESHYCRVSRSVEKFGSSYLSNMLMMDCGSLKVLPLRKCC